MNFKKLFVVAGAVSLVSISASAFSQDSGASASASASAASKSEQAKAKKHATPHNHMRDGKGNWVKEKKEIKDDQQKPADAVKDAEK